MTTTTVSITVSSSTSSSVSLDFVETTRKLTAVVEQQFEQIETQKRLIKQLEDSHLANIARVTAKIAESYNTEIERLKESLAVNREQRENLEAALERMIKNSGESESSRPVSASSSSARLEKRLEESMEHVRTLEIKRLQDEIVKLKDEIRDLKNSRNVEVHTSSHSSSTEDSSSSSNVLPTVIRPVYPRPMHNRRRQILFSLSSSLLPSISE